MLKPEALAIVAAHKLGTCAVICHFSRATFKFRHVIEKVQAEEYHRGYHPFECEYAE